MGRGGGSPHPFCPRCPGWDGVRGWGWWEGVGTDAGKEESGEGWRWGGKWEGMDPGKGWRWGGVEMGRDEDGKRRRWEGWRCGGTEQQKNGTGEGWSEGRKEPGRTEPGTAPRRCEHRARLSSSSNPPISPQTPTTSPTPLAFTLPSAASRTPPPPSSPTSAPPPNLPQPRRVFPAPLPQPKPTHQWGMQPGR